MGISATRLKKEIPLGKVIDDLFKEWRDQDIADTCKRLAEIIRNHKFGSPPYSDFKFFYLDENNNKWYVLQGGAAVSNQLIKAARDGIENAEVTLFNKYNEKYTSFETITDDEGKESEIEVTHTRPKIDWYRKIPLANVLMKKEDICDLLEQDNLQYQYLGSPDIWFNDISREDGGNLSSTNSGVEEKKKEAYVFKKYGSGWQIGQKSNPVLVKQIKGFEYLRVLMQSPGKEIDALEITNIVNEPPTPNKSYAKMTDDELGNEGLSGRNEKGTRSLNDDDKKTLEVCKLGLEEVNQEITEAKSNNDTGKIGELENTKNIILSEIHKLADSDGNLKKYIRVQEDSHEKARTNVPKNIRRSLKKLRATNGGADLADFIYKRLRLSTPLSYTPESDDPIWDFN